MDLRLLSHFVVVAEQLHFRRASQIIGTAQPTLSQQIAALEEHLGVQLFDRSQRSVRLTHAGAMFLKDARRLLADFAAASERAQQAEQAQHGTLSIAAINAPIFAYLPKVVARFRTRYPDVSLQISVMYGTEILEALRRRDVELAFARYKPQDDLGGVILHRHPLRCVLPESHPAAYGDSVSLRSLKGERLVIYPRSLIGEAFDQVIAFCHMYDFFPESIKEATGVESLMGLIACGGGIGILPSSWEAIRFGDIAVRRIDESADWTFESAAFWRRDQESPLARAFVDIAKEVCAELPVEDGQYIQPQPAVDLRAGK
jgi:DNA-binding transcriptional LysR family regulator